MQRQANEEDSRVDGAQKNKQFSGFMDCKVVDEFKISGKEEKNIPSKRKRISWMDRIKGGQDMKWRKDVNRGVLK